MSRRWDGVRGRSQLLLAGGGTDVVDLDKLRIGVGGPPHDEPSDVAAAHRHGPGVGTVQQLAEVPGTTALQATPHSGFPIWRADSGAETPTGGCRMAAAVWVTDQYERKET
jgi:hypothetical protein